MSQNKKLDKKDFLSISDMSKKELIHIFELAEKFKTNNLNISHKNKFLGLIFDKSSEPVLLYTNPIHDYTDYVLEDLGLTEKNI